MNSPARFPGARRRRPRWLSLPPAAGSRAQAATREGSGLNKAHRRTGDLIIATAFSAVVFSGLLFGFNRPSAPARHDRGPVDDTIQLEMPVLPPEPPETAKVEDLPPEDEATPASFAPPSLIDIPLLVPDATFVQTMTPPPPPGIEPAKGIMTIPVTSPPGFGRGMGAIFDIGQLDTPPVIRLQQKPIYPHALLRAGVTGEVKVAFIVDTDGNVRDLYVVSSTSQEFDSAAAQAVSKWKFRPGRKNGRAVNTRMTVPIGFAIE
jgi:periplasmic protein TonB